MDAIAAAAEAIAAARLSGEALGALPEAIRPADLDAAYAVQSEVHRLLANDLRYGPRIGYKIACTTPVMQAYLGVPSPCSAGVFAGGCRRSGAAVSFAAFRRIGVECEIAVRLDRDVGPPFTVEAVRGAVESWMPAIEVVDDRYADWRATGTPTLVADDFFAAGCVLGDPVAAIPPPAVIEGITVINGVEAGRGRGSDVMGDPVNALVWLAGSLAARGEILRRGEIVLTGSLVETRWLASGDRVTVSVAGVGEAALSVA